MRLTRRSYVQLLGTGVAGVATKGLAQGRKPNVVIIMTDDQGAVDINCYGAKDLVTPNMDRIAKEGVRFTRFYSACPVCSPSRAGLLSGRFPAEVGVPGNIGSGKEGLPSKHYLLPEMMKDAGYKTGHFGKWHLGHHEDTLPNGQGFDYSYGHMQGCIDNYSHFFYWKGPNRHDLWRNGEKIHEPGQFFPRRMTEEATAWIEENRNDPLFIYFAMNTPHYPYQGDEKWLKHYSHLEYPRNLYAAFISTMDEYIGQLLDKIAALGLKDDTIIIFQSDNGYSSEERAHFGGGNSGIYSGNKFSVLEGGIRVPGMISWPGHLPKNEVRFQTLHSVDWYPTIAELCGLSSPEGLSGRSILPVLHSPNLKTPDRPLHWVQGGNQWAISEGRWKLCFNPKTRDQGKYLFDVEADPSEKKNLINEQPEIAERLERLHDEWAATWQSGDKKTKQ
jgi:arylsulfatase A